MGQSRIDTVAKLIVSPVEQHEQIAKDFALAKLKRLEQKYPEVEQEDRFDRCDRSTARMWQQFQVSQVLESPEMSEHLLDKTPGGKAKVSGDFLSIQTLGQQFESAETIEDHVQIYCDLVSLLLGPEPLVKKSALDMLALFASQTPDEVQTEFLARPLAVALGLHVRGSAQEHKHREAVRQLVKTHFQGELADTGKMVQAMLVEEQRGRTAEVLTTYREFLSKREAK